MLIRASWSFSISTMRYSLTKRRDAVHTLTYHARYNSFLMFQSEQYGLHLTYKINMDLNKQSENEGLLSCV